MDSIERRDTFAPEVAEAIVSALARGVPFKWACEAHGVPERTGRNWREARPDFDHAVRSTRAGKVGDYYSSIVRAAEEGDVKAAKWLVDKAESQYHDDGQRPGAEAAVEPSRALVLPFREFAQEAWTHIDPAPLVWSWHLDEWCDALEEAAKKRHAGEAVRLVLEGPPGATKSRPVSILWQPWVWTWWPESEWITTSWDESLALDLSGFSRDLVTSSWYQARWPLALAKDSAGDWGNARGGRRLARGLKSRVTGDHAQFLVLDDPVKEQLTRIGTPHMVAQAVGGACGIWFGTYGTRAIDHVGCYVIAMQGLHVNDPGAVGVREKGYKLISFPWHFNPEKADPRDHRTEAGESLCSRLTEEKYAAITLDIGPTATEAQCEQNRQPPGGQMLKAGYMARRWSVLPADLQAALASGRPLPGQKWITAWDLTFKGKATSDWTVGQVWCAQGGDRYLVDQVRGKWGFRDAREQLRALALRYPVVGSHLLEDAANAAATEDDIRGSMTGVLLEPVGGGCLARTQAVEGVWASGSVVLPAGLPWVDCPGGFVDEHLRFSGDGTETDDQVSASSLALLHLKVRSGLPAWASAMQAMGRR